MRSGSSFVFLFWFLIFSLVALSNGLTTTNKRRASQSGHLQTSPGENEDVLRILKIVEVNACKE